MHVKLVKKELRQTTGEGRPMHAAGAKTERKRQQPGILTIHNSVIGSTYISVTEGSLLLTSIADGTYCISMPNMPSR